MVGRGAARRRLRRVLEEGAAGSSRVLALAGPAGVGKTTLLDWAAEAGRERFEVHTTSGRDDVRAVAVLRDVLAQLDGAGRIGDVPLLLVVDDLDGAPAPCRAAVDELATRLGHHCGARPVVLLLAERPVPRPDLADSPWGRLDLAGLTVRQAASLLRDRGVDAVAPDVLSTLVRQTAGSPLALRELAAVLTTEQMLGRRPLPDPLPLGPAGRARFGSLLAGLPDRTRQVLLVVALAEPDRPEVLQGALAELGLGQHDLAPALDRHLVLLPSWQLSEPMLRSACHELSSSGEVRRVRAVLDHQRRHLRVRAGVPVWGPASPAEIERLSADAEAVAPSDPATAASALLAAARSAQTTGDVATALRLARRADELRPADSDEAALAGAVIGQLTTWVVGRADPSAAPRNAPAEAAAVRAQWLLWAERHDEAESQLVPAVVAARRDKDHPTLAHLLVLQADLAWWRGDWQRGRCWAEEATALATRQQLPALAAGSHSVWARFAVQGKGRSAQRTLAAAEVAADEHEYQPARLALLGVRVHVSLARGDLPAALRLGAVGDALSRELSLSCVPAMPFLPEYVEAAVRAADARAEGLLSDLAGFAVTNGSSWTRAVWLRCLGMAAVSGWQEAFEESLALTPVAALPFEHARTLGCWGERLVAEHRPLEGRALLSSAEETFARLGSDLWRRHVVRAAAAPDRAAGDVTGASLTERERRVCRLVVEGATNRDVARQLLLSEKTIEYHVHNVLLKTGAANRTQLARLLDHTTW